VFELFCVWVALFGPATEPCTYVVMAVPVAWALGTEFARPTGWRVRGLLVASLLLMGPLVSDLSGPVLREWARHAAIQAMGALLFAGYLAWRLVTGGVVASQLPVTRTAGLRRAA
jgi:hypothetical protein